MCVCYRERGRERELVVGEQVMTELSYLGELKIKPKNKKKQINKQKNCLCTLC